MNTLVQFSHCEIQEQKKTVQPLAILIGLDGFLTVENTCNIMFWQCENKFFVNQAVFCKGFQTAYSVKIFCIVHMYSFTYQIFLQVQGHSNSIF